MADFKLKIETSADRGESFWKDMGPFFASRELAKELGGPLYDDKDMHWVIARVGRRVVGWAAFVLKNERGELEWSWVAPDYRRKGLWRAMHKLRVAALKKAGAKTLRTSVRDPNMIQALEKEGLKKVGSHGSWAKMETQLEAQVTG